MREIVLDTETTGLDFKTGHRLIEVGCIEMINRIPTGREFHQFVYPERDVPADAVAIHGITSAQLAGKPIFKNIASDLLAFLGDDTLVIHNAQFDVNFLNFELELVGAKTLSFDRVVDTLALARRKHPAGPNTLDALCKRYGIDNTKRVKHGALVDSLLLAEVYIELLGERQAALVLETMSARAAASAVAGGKRKAARQRPELLPSRVTDSEITAHRAFVDKLGVKALWAKFWPEAAE